LDLSAPPGPTGAEGVAGQPWFRETCGSTSAHTIIARIEHLLAQRLVSPGQSANLLRDVLDYKGTVPQARCPLLCARFITVVKRLAFIEAPEALYGKLFGAAVETWKTGLGFDRTNAGRYGNFYSPVFSIQTFLQGWSADLGRVRKKALLAYAGFLRFHDVHTDSVQFDQAVEAFVERVKNAMTRADWILAGRIALNFGQEILGPLLSHDRAMALKHTKEAAALIGAAVLLDPARALGDDNKPVPMALRWLEDHIIQSGIPRLERDRKSPETGAGLREGAYKVLNDLWRNLEPPHRLHMEQHYSTLLPMLGGWDRRDPRLAAPPGWWAWVSFDHAGKSWKIGGAVFDLCPSGRGFHITFTGEVERCEDWGNGGGVDIAVKGGEIVPVKNVSVGFQLPDGSTFACGARALRGWKYEVTRGVYKDFCGAVFGIDKPEDAAALKSRLGGLTPQSGMAPPPNKAPVPPAVPLPTAPSAGTMGQPGHEPSPQSDTTGGDHEQSARVSAGTTATTGPPSINVPAAECYGELEVYSDSEARLRIFLRKQGPGKRPEMCQPIRLTKQARDILLAGIEDARQRYIDDMLAQAKASGIPRDVSECQPPDTKTFILEWTQDELAAILHEHKKESFGELDPGERKALKSAMGRLRRLVTFGKKQKCKFITSASRDFVRKTTLPIRLRKAGQPQTE
jgi:hypothetical protein